MSINKGIIRHKRYKTDANGNHTLVSEWTSATTVEMEDGKTLPEALEEVTGVVDITQAEYDKLTTEQKNNGQIYNIIDAPDELPLDAFEVTYKETNVANTLNLIEAEQETQNVHLATDKELQLETAKGGIRVDKIEGGQHKSKNIWDEKWETGSITSGDGLNYGSTSQIRSSNYIKVKQNTSYYFVVGGGQLTGKFYDENKVAIGTSWGINTSTDKSITTPSDAEYFRFCMQPSYGTTYLHNIAIIEGTSGTYEPYGLHVAGDMGYIKDLSNLSWSKTSSGNRFYTYDTIPSLAQFVQGSVPNIYCNKYSVSSSLSDDKTITAYYTGGHNYISITDSGYSDLNSFKESIKDLELAYEVADGATPSQYCEVIKEHGKNLFESIYGYHTVSNGLSNNEAHTLGCSNVLIPCNEGDTYTFSCDLNYNGNYVGKRIGYYDSSKNFISRSDEIKTIKDYTFTIPSGVSYFFASVYGYGISQITIAKDLKLQLEKGDIATAYVQYQHKTALIPLSQPLCEGNTIEKIGDKWYEVQRWMHKKISNSNLIVLSGDITQISLGTADFPNANNTDSIRVISDKFDDSDITTTKGSIRFLGKTVSEVQDMIPFTVVYKLFEPKYVEITDQATLYQLESYEGQTNIETADKLAEITVGYGKSDVVATALGADNKAEIEKYERIEADYGEDVTSHFVLNSNFTSTNFKAWRIGKVVFLKGILTCVGSVTNGGTIFTHDLQPLLTEFTGKMVEESSSYKQISIQFRNTTIAVSSHNLPTANNRYDISCFYIIK